MDSLTHTLAAVMMSRAGLNRWCPRATPLLVVGANIADADFISLAGDPLMVLEWHRGPTHSILLSPLVGAAAVAVVALFAWRHMRWGRAWVVAWAGTASHCLIDWTNMYGVRLLSPFNENWYALSINSTFDLWIWLILLVAGGWMMLSRLVSSEIGAAGSNARAVALAALAALTVYGFGRYVLHERAKNVLDARIYSGEAPLRVHASPTPVNPFRWLGIVETRATYQLFEVDLFGGQFDPGSGRIFYKPERSPGMGLAMETEPFRKFLWWAKVPLWRVGAAEGKDPSGTTRVQVLDLRFAEPGEDAFAATAILDSRGRISRSWFQYGARGSRPRFR
jgi:inner membrane protein